MCERGREGGKEGGREEGRKEGREGGHDTCFFSQSPAPKKGKATPVGKGKLAKGTDVSEPSPGKTLHLSHTFTIPPSFSTTGPPPPSAEELARRQKLEHMRKEHLAALEHEGEWGNCNPRGLMVRVKERMRERERVRIGVPSGVHVSQQQQNRR